MRNAHLVKATQSSVVPTRVVSLDTEAVRTKEAGFDVQRWRLGCTAATHFDSHSERWTRTRTERHATPESLWQAVALEARPEQRTIVIAHNLSYDLRLSRGLEIMSGAGWVPDKLIVSPTHVGMDLTQADAKLILVDTTTVLPTSLEVIAKILGRHKPALPLDGDSDEAWYERCEADASILLEAYLVVLDALRLGDLGCWARTGSGIGWNTYRRHHCQDKVLVHDNEDLLTIEHNAAYGGRGEAWRHGTLKGGPFTEWDHELAYANVLADETLPAYLVDHVVGLTMAHIERRYPKMRFLCRATVDQGLPILPTTDEHGIFWPIGRLEGWWWECELMAAQAEGARVVLHEAWRYRGAPWLATWASFVLDACGQTETPHDAIVAMCAKHWQRALVGRTAMRYRDWEMTGPALMDGVQFMPLVELETGRRGAGFDISGRHYEAWERIWGDQSVPQLHSAVLAHPRLRLWKAMRTAGLAPVVYCDTDARITAGDGTRRLKHATDRGELGSLRPKAQMRSLTVHAPRYVTSSTYTRVAGVPKRRRQIGRNTFVAETWESIVVSLQRQDPGTVRVFEQVSEMSEVDWRRLHVKGGATLPYVVDGGGRVAEDGKAALG